jgi:hypothetical protein
MAGPAAEQLGVLLSARTAIRVAEVVVFFLIGPSLVARLGAPGVMALAATAGLLRWMMALLCAVATPLALAPGRYALPRMRG